MNNEGTKHDQSRFFWRGEVPRFARLREGGPGRPAWLLGMAVAAVGLGLWGRTMMEGQGMNSPGPALVLLSLLWLVFLVIWMLIKAGLRDTQVVFCLSDKGVGIEPSESQKQLDRRIGVLTRLVFFSTLKGGQWAAWYPFTPWKDVKKMDIHPEKQEILIRGGPWDVRLICTEENFSRVLDMLGQYCPQACAGSD
jgi:hypothetical protein